ncbi:hypothetical protein JCM11251_003475 [Rhodosporidiobolus azoricus]
MKPLYAVPTLLSALALLPSPSTALPTSVSPFPSDKVPPVPIVIWHGLGDRYDAPGLLSLKADLEARPDLEGVFVHIVKVGEDGSADQRATFFGSAQSQIALVCDQLRALPGIVDPKLNPRGTFDALGFSQGGQLLRGVVEKCGPDLKVRNLITVGSQHMGISAMPPCPPNSSPFSPCRLMHLALIKEGLYSSWAQHQVIPAQYWREQGRINDYLKVNTFLKDINNEREADKQPDDGSDSEEDEEGWYMVSTAKDEPRNATYKENFSSLNRFVMLRFSEDITVVPPHSSHFTLPSPNATNCPLPPLPADPLCYSTPLPWSSLPLYTEDYIGLRALHERGRVVKGVCEGAHMEVTDDCWEGIVGWFGESGERGPKTGMDEGGEEEVWYTSLEVKREAEGDKQFVLQL